MSDALMFAEGLLSKQQVIEEFGIPKNLESKLFAILKPRVGKLYWKKDVDPALEKVLGAGNRPPFATNEFSFEKEDLKVNGVGHIEGNNLADVVKEFVEWVKPRLSTAYPLESKPQPRMLSPAEAAQMMRLHIQTVMRWCRERRIEATKIGNKWLIPQESVDAYMRKCRLLDGRGDK